MSDTATSGEAPVAPAETVSAPSWPVANSAQAPTAAQSPTFGTSRGSGLLRGKRPSAPATKSNDSSSPAAPGAYQPTAVQVLTSESTYKNPFAPEPPVVAPSAPVAAVVETAPPAAPVSAPVAAPVARPAPQAEIKEITTADEPVGKVEINILPPEGKSRPAQSWESASFPSSGNQGQPRADQSARPQPQGRRDGGRVEDRPIFRTERARERMEQESRDAAANPSASTEPQREQRENREPRQPRDPREQRQPRDPREQREPRQPRDPREQRQPRDPREQRPFEKAPVTTPPIEAKKPAGFFGWLKNLFAEDTVSPPEKSASAHPSADQGQRGFDGGNGGGRRHERGGRGGYRGGNGNGGGGYRSSQPRAEGGQTPQAPQGEPGQQQHQGGGERRFDGAGGSGHRHRGGRGRGGRGGYRGGNGGNGGGGGEGRSDSSPGPSS